MDSSKVNTGLLQPIQFRVLMNWMSSLDVRVSETSVNNGLMIALQDLENDMAVRSSQLDELVKRCHQLEAFPSTAPLASELYTHLLMLQENFTEAGAQLHSRLIFLQV